MRVVGVAHIGKVLVREELNDARWHIGQARLAIVPIPHGTPRKAADIVCNAGLHHISEIA